MTKSTPKDFFMNLLSFGLLYTTVVSFITMWFQYINVLYPELNQYQGGVLDSIRWSTSILVVVFPVFVLTAWLLGREFKIESDKRDVWVRRWLVYLTLFISAVTIIIDLVTLVYNFFNGELSTAFFLKILVVLLVSVAVFGYYLWDLRRTNFKSKKPKLFAWIAGAAILASVVWSFFLIGTPGEQRARRQDQQRINDLSMIQNEVISFWTRKNVLPAKLDELSSDISGFRPPIDPKTRQAYEYKIKDKLTFELCADFASSSKDSKYNPDSRYPLGVIESYPYPGPYQQNWEHESGRVCFSRTIDPELYKNSGTPIPLKY